MANPNDLPILPNNLEAERAVLGAILVNNSALELAGILTPADFFLPDHQRIYKTIVTLREDNTPVDLVTLCDAMAGDGSLGLAGGAAYVSSLIDGVPHISNIAHHAEIIRDKAHRRAAIRQAAALQKMAMDPHASNEQIEAEFKNAGTITAHTNGNGTHKLKSYSLSEFMKAEFPTPEHLVEGVIPRGGSVLIVALPHRLKSWFTTSLAMSCTRPGMVLGKLEVKKPVRTILVQVEDFPGQLQERMASLINTVQFKDCDPSACRIIPRCDFSLPDERWYQEILREVQEFRADHVILDVVRRIFRGDINSPKDTAAFLEQIDRLRETTGCAVTLVHHENKKGEEIMTASAGSYNLPGWATVLIQFKRKSQEAHITHVEIEVDNKLAQSPEPMRMILDLTSDTPVRVEELDEGGALLEALDRLGSEWTIRDLSEALDIHKSNAHRRVKKWIASGKVEKVSGGKRGKHGGLARYRSLDPMDHL